MIFLFLKSLIAGMIVTAPIGPSGVLCLKKNLSKNHKSGKAIGAGAIVADFIYCLIAILGFTFLYKIVLDNQKLFYLIAGFFLVAITSINFFIKKEKTIKTISKKTSNFENFLFGFVVTILNPTILASFFIYFTLIKINFIPDPSFLLTVIFGAFSGIVLIWTTAHFTIHKFKNRFETEILEKINSFANYFILFAGLFLLLKGIVGF
jgi:threonine/homoserine/homoserine lactone efflux protein